jgi:hypothetical protein
VVVGGAADRVDAHHLCAELAQRHTRQWHRHEAGYLDDPDTGQWSRRVGHAAKCKHLR